MLPPFNLFRVPARWLVLLAWGGALLAGHGLDALAKRPTWRRLAGACALPLGLMALTPLAAALVPAGAAQAVGAAAPADVAGWPLPLAIVAAVMALPPRLTWWPSAVAALAAAELFVAAQGLPYNQFTTPEAYVGAPGHDAAADVKRGRAVSIRSARCGSSRATRPNWPVRSPGS